MLVILSSKDSLNCGQVDLSGELSLIEALRTKNGIGTLTDRINGSCFATREMLLVPGSHLYFQDGNCNHALQ